MKIYSQTQQNLIEENSSTRVRLIDDSVLKHILIMKSKEIFKLSSIPVSESGKSQSENNKIGEELMEIINDL